MQHKQRLTRTEKEAIGLLSIGTFLEYFDMMLYVHMAILLNELFFPKTSSHTQGILAAFAFCTSYVFRPLGAILFGYIGDHIGRKSSIIITTLLMAVACLVMAILPTYEQIGLTASVIMILCRITQSIAATGELTGAQIYLTETLKPPMSYLAVGCLTEICLLGGTTALALATIILKLQANWRIIFLLGSIIALIGTTARVRLKESIEFADLQRRMKKAIVESNEQGLGKIANVMQKTNACWKERTPWQMVLAYFAISAGGPLCFYIAYIYAALILRHKFSFSIEQVMVHNLKLSMLGFIAGMVLIISSKYILPLKLIKARAIGLLVFLPIISVVIGCSNNLNIFMLIQSLLIIFSLAALPAVPMLLKHFPIFRRFTYTSLIYSLSRAVMYPITSFGLIWIVDHVGKYGILVITLPVIIGFLWGVKYFMQLELKEQESLLKARVGKIHID